jgi:hypothetical protein
MTSLQKIELVDSLCRKEPDTTIREYLECLEEIEAVQRAVAKPILQFTWQPEKPALPRKKKPAKATTQAIPGLTRNQARTA